MKSTNHHHIPTFCHCGNEIERDSQAPGMCDACHYEWILTVHPALAVEVATAVASPAVTWSTAELERLLADVLPGAR